MKNTIYAFIATLLFVSLSFLPLMGGEEPRGAIQNVTIKINSLNNDEIILETTVDKAEKIITNMEDFKEAVKIKDERQVLSLISELKKEGIILDGTILQIIKNYWGESFPIFKGEYNLTNVMCLVMGSGHGIFLYSADLLAFYGGYGLWLLLDTLFLNYGQALTLFSIMLYFYAYIWLICTHSIPLRIINPVTAYFGLGEFTTIGLKGIKTIYTESLMLPFEIWMLGFIGVSINIYIPLELSLRLGKPNLYHFCLGYSLSVVSRLSSITHFYNLEDDNIYLGGKNE